MAVILILIVLALVFGFMSAFGTTLAVIAGIFGIAIIIAVIYGLHQRKVFNEAEQFECPSKVVSKTSQVKGSNNSTKTEYFVSFDINDGARQNFPVNVNFYNSIVEGETGTLIYRKHKYRLTYFIVDFKPS